MANQRLDRELETRDVQERPRKWVRPGLLPDPKPRAGWVHRWIRMSSRGEADPTNLSSKLREGWEPVLAKDYPEIVLMAVENERFKDNVMIGGLLLCRAPEEMMRERQEHFDALADSQSTSVDNMLLRDNDPRMPLFQERKSAVTFGPK